METFFSTVLLTMHTCVRKIAIVLKPLSLVSRLPREECSSCKLNSTSTMICTNIFISPSLRSFCQTIHAASDKICKCREYTMQRAQTCRAHSCTCITCVVAAARAVHSRANLPPIKPTRIVEQYRWLTKSLIHVMWRRLWDSRPYAFLSATTESRRAAAKLILIRKGRAYTTSKIKTVRHV